MTCRDRDESCFRKKYSSQNSYDAHQQSRRHKECVAEKEANPKPVVSKSDESTPKHSVFGPRTPGYATMTDVRR